MFRQVVRYSGRGFPLRAAQPRMHMLFYFIQHAANGLGLQALHTSAARPGPEAVDLGLPTPITSPMQVLECVFHVTTLMAMFPDTWSKCF